MARCGTAEATCGTPWSAPRPPLPPPPTPPRLALYDSMQACRSSARDNLGAPWVPRWHEERPCGGATPSPTGQPLCRCQYQCAVADARLGQARHLIPFPFSSCLRRSTASISADSPHHPPHAGSRRRSNDSLLVTITRSPLPSAVPTLPACDAQPGSTRLPSACCPSVHPCLPSPPNAAVSPVCYIASRCCRD